VLVPLPVAPAALAPSGPAKTANAPLLELLAEDAPLELECATYAELLVSCPAYRLIPNPKNVAIVAKLAIIPTVLFTFNICLPKLIIFLIWI
jgi:hypothetical protein